MYSNKPSELYSTTQDQCKCRRDSVNETTVWSVRLTIDWQRTIASITSCHCFLEVGSMGCRLLHCLLNQELGIICSHLFPTHRHTSILYTVKRCAVWVCGSLSMPLCHTVVASLRPPCGAPPPPASASLRPPATQQTWARYSFRKSSAKLRKSSEKAQQSSAKLSKAQQSSAKLRKAQKKLRKAQHMCTACNTTKKILGVRGSSHCGAKRTLSF